MSASGLPAAELPACEGGSPVREAFLPFFRPSLGPEEEAAVLEVLRSGWLTTGPRTEAFEAEFAAFTGARHALAVSSCTAGLDLLLRGLGIGPGDEVIVPAVTFPSTANVVLQAGARPVFADVHPERLSLDPDSVRRVLGSATRALIAVHLFGWPCEMDPLQALCAEHGLALLEDAAHGIGARYGGRSVGTFGDGASFSFYATKNMTTGEGGMLTTERDELAARLRRVRLHGIDVDATGRDGKAYRHWEAVSLGWKCNLTDLQAALGRVQLGRLPGFLAERRRLDARYRAILDRIDAFQTVGGPDGAENAAHLFPILIRPGALRIDRDRLLQALLAENVGVGVHFRALPLHRHFREAVGTPPEAVPVASESSARLLSLPLYPGLSDADLDDVGEALARLARYYRA